MIILDTHALVWWVGDPEKLSPGARKAIEEAAEQDRILVSSISAWEISLLVEKGRLELALSPQEWLEKCEALPFLDFVPVDNRIALLSTRLTGFPHRDPVDRIIIATAITLGASIVTKDEKIRAYPQVKTIW